GAPLRRAAPASRGAEEASEQVADVGSLEALAVREALVVGAAGSAGTCARPEPAAVSGRGHVADLVVLRALLLVAQHVVRRGALLEGFLRVLVPRVRAGVELLRELAVRLLDLGSRRVLGHAECLVVVLLEPLPPDVAVHRGPLGVTSGRPSRRPGG